MLQNESKRLYNWGHVKTAINIKRPIRVSLILGSFETKRFKNKTVPWIKLTNTKLYILCI